MIIIVGLVILIAAVIVAVGGVLANSGSGHPLPHDFAVLGYHVTGSTGTLFLYGIVVGAAALLGLSLLLAGARRTSRRGRDARRGLRQSRRTAAVSQDRADLIGQRDTARAFTSPRPAAAPRAAMPPRSQGQRTARPARASTPTRPPDGSTRERKPAVSAATRIWHHHPNVSPAWP